MRRRRFLQAASAVVLLGGCATTRAQQADTQQADDAAPLALAAEPCLLRLDPTVAALAWATNRDCVSWVEFGTGDPLDRRAQTSRHGLFDAQDRVHRVTLRGLEPGTTYRYRVMSREIVRFNPYQVDFGETAAGPVRSFETPPAAGDTVSFVVFNDVHNSRDMWNTVFPLAKARPFDLAFLNGDIMNHIHNHDHVIDFLYRPFGTMLEGQRPMVFVRGNHETRGQHARKLPDYLCLPEDRYYFAFDRGPVRFLVLDSGEDKDDGNNEYFGLVDFDRYRDEQRAWLEQEIRSPEFAAAPFRVVVVHMPLFGGRGYGVEDCRRKFGPLLEEGRVDLMISGHTHRYTVVEPEPGAHGYPVVIGGGSKPPEATVIHATADRERLDIVMTRGDGAVVAERRIERRNPA